MNRAPVTAGIQKTSTCWLCISHLPTDFTMPDETIKLAQRMAPRASEVLRPSI